jgi:trigger factor
MVGAYGDAAALKRAYQQNADAMRQVESLALEDQVVDWVLAHAKVHEVGLDFKEVMNFEADTAVRRTRHPPRNARAH